MNWIRLVVVLGACLLGAGAQAQWQWIDKDGHRVFSDRAPPPDILPKNILKQPGPVRRTIIEPADAALPAAGASAAASAAGAGELTATPKLSNVDKDLAEKKKQADAVAAAKVRAEDDKLLKAKAESCERARANKALIDSGVRVSQTNTKGEREVLDDAGRAAELRRIQLVMDASCK